MKTIRMLAVLAAVAALGYLAAAARGRELGARQAAARAQEARTARDEARSAIAARRAAGDDWDDFTAAHADAADAMAGAAIPESGPLDIVRALGAVFSPDLGAYAAGEIDISQVRCVLCGVAPCQCRSCPARYSRRFAIVLGADPSERECGMTVGPDGKCPRGHYYPLGHCPLCAHRFSANCGCACCTCPNGCDSDAIGHQDYGSVVIVQCRDCQATWNESK